MPSATEVLSAFHFPWKVRLLEIGQRFGGVEVIEHAMPVRRGNGRMAAASICRCRCGHVAVYKNNSLLNGAIVSCGCNKVVHGDARASGRASEYIVWRAMKSRCENPNSPGFDRYGGSGIAVCQRWSESYAAFCQDMGPRPYGFSIDRIDNEKGYEPGNCRWADRWTQAQNKRQSVMVTFEGRSLCLKEACREAGLEDRYMTIHARVRRWGMTFTEAISKPFRYQDISPEKG